MGYEETFSPVAMHKSICILLSIATCLDYEIWQMDVKTAFLNGYLEESNQKVLWLKANNRKSASCLGPFMD